MTHHDPDAVPVRTAADWRPDDDGSLTVVREVAPRNRLDAALMDAFGADRRREVSLDPVGATVWRHCDGDHTVADVADAVADAHDPERVAPVEETLSHFLVQLRERDLVRFEDAPT